MLLKKRFIKIQLFFNLQLTSWWTTSSFLRDCRSATQEQPTVRALPGSLYESSCNARMAMPVPHTHSLVEHVACVRWQAESSYLPCTGSLRAGEMACRRLPASLGVSTLGALRSFINSRWCLCCALSSPLSLLSWDSPSPKPSERHSQRSPHPSMFSMWKKDPIRGVGMRWKENRTQAVTHWWLTTYFWFWNPLLEDELSLFITVFTSV